ncbi:thiamine-phosphate kinase [Sinosporangium siamense]|uniref:thiamine-phosphate kinase n=1 Tax=Sinosporangium siamense TaxID=1367973 RepID=UPI001951DABF|nr:thiamine-phosphate kinase [Sinosporangium siamense]
MRVGNLGEFSLIQRIVGRLPQSGTVLLGPGDDGAVVAVPDARVVVTTDLLLEGRHFRRDWSSGYEVGRKAAAQNLSDVAAMGARPTALFLGLGLPADTDVAWVEDLADGMRDECHIVGASVAGGDIAQCDLVVLGVTALGDLGGRAAITRAGARPGDVVAVTGRLGWAAAGLALLEAGHRESSEPDLARAMDEVIGAHRRPAPPYSCGPEAAALGATAMLDVSDGLIQDIGHIAAASGVGVEIDPAAFEVPGPVGVAGRFLGVDPLDWMLTGGDDHALAAVFPVGIGLPAHWTVIGEVIEGAGVQVDGRVYDRSGWNHFQGKL